MSKAKWPSQIKYIVGNEGCERFSFYGMRSILTVVMVNYLMIEKSTSAEVVHLFIMASYFLPLLGAYLADRFLGRYHTILYFSLFYCAGHATLALFENTAGLYTGLSLIALGAGSIKPCVSAFVGDQFKKGQEDLVTKVYNLFYFMINLGSTVSSLLTPLTLKWFGPSVAFGIPGVLMGIATLVFWLGRKQYTYMPPSGADKDSFWTILGTGLVGLVTSGSFMKPVRAKHAANRIEEFLAVINILKIFAATSLFWSLFDQSASTWVLMGMNMKQTFMLFGREFTVDPSQMQAANPILVICFIPAFVLIYPLMNKVIKLTPLRKMTIGMFFTCVAYSSVCLLQYAVERGVQVNILWQILPYTLLTASEIMVSIVGLEFAYTQAPPSVKSTVMSFWLLSVALGNLITVILVSLKIFPVATGNYFALFTGLMFLTAVIFAVLAKFYKPRTYLHA